MDARGTLDATIADSATAMYVDGSDAAPEAESELRRDGGIDSGFLRAEAGSDASAYVDAAAEAAPPPYTPCPANGGACKVLPLGDSITWGSSSPRDIPGGYRVELFHDALADHKNITFVGEPGQANGPPMVDGVAFPADNSGHPGWRIDMIAGLVPNPAFKVFPDIILLHAGTNNSSGAANQAASLLGSLIDKIVDDAPNALLVVAQIIPITNNNINKKFAEDFNPLIPPLVMQRASAGKHVILADQFSTFQVATMMSPDGIHPNQVGYAHMGDVWYAAIKSALP